VEFRNTGFTRPDIGHLYTFEKLFFPFFIYIINLEISKFLVLVNSCKIQFLFGFAVKLDEFDVFVVLDLYTGEIHTI